MKGVEGIMNLPGSPWFYTELELQRFAYSEIEKHRAELSKLYHSDIGQFEKKIRGIVIGTWQKKGAYGRETRANMDRIIGGLIDFAKIDFSCRE
jgi:hypothetical protein